MDDCDPKEGDEHFQESRFLSRTESPPGVDGGIGPAILVDSIGKLVGMEDFEESPDVRLGGGEAGVVDRIRLAGERVGKGEDLFGESVHGGETVGRGGGVVSGQ